jgi:hypothetical protein
VLVWHSACWSMQVNWQSCNSFNQIIVLIIRNKSIFLWLCKHASFCLSGKQSKPCTGLLSLYISSTWFKQVLPNLWFAKWPNNSPPTINVCTMPTLFWCKIKKFFLSRKHQVIRVEMAYIQKLRRGLNTL